MRLQGDIVNANDITISSLVEEKKLLHQEILTTTPSETDSSENDTDLSSQQQTSHAYSDSNLI